MYRFSAEIKIIGVNPYVSVPDEILAQIFQAAGKEKGPIPVCGQIAGADYTQTLVKYVGEWRLYINTSMLKNSPQHVGKTLSLTVGYDPKPREVPLHPKLAEALTRNPEAKKVFDSLIPSRRKEIMRYIANLKNDESVEKNVVRAIGFLLNKNGFVGRKSVK